ncbi:MAG: hypothetical protein ACREP7_23020 [Lysobacter sp.]
MAWLLLSIAVVALALAPAAWLLRAMVARAVGARPAYGAALWTVIFGAVLWAMLAVVGLIVSRDTGFASGAAFVGLMMTLSWLALSSGVRMYLPDPAGAKLRWRRALWVALLPVLFVWAELAVAMCCMDGGWGRS